MAIPLKLEIGRTYTITDANDCQIVGSSGRVLCDHKGGNTQSSFVASEISATASSDTAALTATFSGAPVGNGNGGGVQPESPEVLPLSYDSTLADGRVYHTAATGQGVLDLHALSVAPNATARIWLDYGGGPVAFPDSWVWSDSAEFQLPAAGDAPQGVGDFTPGETYLLTVCRYTYGDKDFTIAHRALTVKPAQA